MKNNNKNNKAVDKQKEEVPQAELKDNNTGRPGSILQSARKEKRFSLEYVSKHTKISEDKLRALEQDDYSYFPAKFYARSFMRDYAAFLGVSINFLEFIPLEGSQPISPAQKLSKAAEIKDIPLKTKENYEKRRPLLTQPSRGFILAVILILTAYFLFMLTPVIPLIFGFSGRDYLVVSDDTCENTTLDENTGDRKLMLMGVAHSNVWVRVRGDGSLIYEGTLRSGTTRYWESEYEINIRIGNTDALALYFRENTAEEYARVDIRSGAAGGTNNLHFSAEDPLRAD